MAWVYYALLLAVSASGIGLSLLGLPGLWLIVGAAAAYAWATHGAFIGLWGLVTLLAAATLSEVLEVALGGIAAKRAGGTKRAMIGAVTGGIVGGIVGTAAIPIPLVGTVAGACAGSFAGAFAVELLWVGKSTRDSFRVGSGAAAGRFVGLVVKTAIGAAMLLIVAAWALPVSFGTIKPPATPTSAPATFPATTVGPTTHSR
jgi:uncharacterized protein YqgC (DUF456 family)